MMQCHSECMGVMYCDTGAMNYDVTYPSQSAGSLVPLFKTKAKGPIPSCSSSSRSITCIDNKMSYKQISCVEHFHMRSNIFTNIYFVFCKKHDFLLQKAP